MKNRSHHKEHLDDPGFQGSDLKETLQGLSFINRFFGNQRSTLQAIKTAFKYSYHPQFKIVDLGCGAGDNLRAIAHWCEMNDYSVNLIGIDGSHHVLDVARSFEDADSNIQYTQADILAADFEIEPCDLLISSHFIYHFTDQELVGFLRRTKSKVNTAIIFSDLYRSKLSYLLFKCFSIFLPTNRIVKRDGLIAIKRSFKITELKQLLNEAGIAHYSLKLKWAFRYILTIIVD